MTKWFVFIDGRQTAEAETRDSAETFKLCELHRNPSAKIEIEKRRVDR